MARRDLLLLAAGIAAAAAAAGLAIRLGKGTVDSEGGPAARPPVPSVPPVRRGFPSLVLPPGLPPPAAAALREAHAALAAGTRDEAARVLASLAVPDAAGPVAPVAAKALEALAPALEWMIAEGAAQDLAGPAMEAAAGLARRGGLEGKRVLERTGLVDTAFALQAATGPPDLRRQAALLMGFVATDRAVGWLVALLGKAAETEVREAAAAALGEAFRVNGRLPPEAVLGLKAALEAPGSPPAVRRACLGALREAFDLAAPYGIVDGAVAALADPDPGTRQAAADLFFAHPAAAAGTALAARAAAEPEERILATVADALGAMRPAPPGAAVALERRLPDLRDPAALEAVRRAIGSLRAPR